MAASGGSTCPDCTLINPPGATICEACSAFLDDCTPCSAEGSGVASSEDDDFLVTARRYWDGLSDACSEFDCGVGLVVSSRRIAWVGALDELPERFLGLTARLHHADTDCTLMPGLIDSHVHIEFDPSYALHSQPTLSESALMQTMQTRAQNMVRHGITTCRDLGGKGGALALRALIREGACIGPRLLCAGQPITKPRGHCHQWGGEAAGEEQIRRVVRRQLSAPTSADVRARPRHIHLNQSSTCMTPTVRTCRLFPGIAHTTTLCRPVRLMTQVVKIMATGGVRTAGTSPAEAAFTMQEVAACVEEAAAGGRPCAAHAHGVQGILNAAAAGVSTIEHCSWVNAYGSWGDYDATAIETIAQKGIAICPTIGAGWAKMPPLQNAMAPALQQMRAAGVRLIAGSDAGAIPSLRHHRLADGLVVMARCAGFSHAEALRSCTSDAAIALNLGSVCGTVAPGRSADVILVRGNPILDLEALCAPLLGVVCRGQVVPPCAGAANKPGDSWKPPWTWAKGRDEAVAAAGGFGDSAKCACARGPS